MIEKKRLEKLIKQGATIWTNNICPIKLVNDNQHNIELYKDCLYIEEEFKSKSNIWWEDYTKEFKDLFETKEEAEWHKEFGCIERTERLELPTWEEFDKKGYIEFVGKEATKLILEKTLTIDCDREPISYYVLKILVNDYDHRLLFEAEYTKENYTLACRKAKELFLGEKK